MDVLTVPMQGNDADAATIGEYLTELLLTLWREEEGFSGKRPFGNSGWQGDVYLALVAAGKISGVIDPDGYLDDCDEDAADALVMDAIRAMGGRF